MNPRTKKILEYINTENIKFLFSFIKPDFSNLVEVYTNNLNLWFCNNSDEKTTKDGKGIEITNGILLNPDNIIFSKTKNGFELTEIDFINDQIKYINKLDFENLTFAEKKQFEAYKSFLINKQNPPQKVESVKSDEVKKELHNHIFKNNAIEVFQSMFDSFGITDKSRTDMKFIFEEMKKDGLIQKTVNQKTFLDWLSEPPYQISVQKTSNYSKTPERNSIYSTAKQLFKK